MEIAFFKALKLHLLRKKPRPELWLRACGWENNNKKVFWQAGYCIYLFKLEMDADSKDHSTGKIWRFLWVYKDTGEGYHIFYVLFMKLKCKHGYFNLFHHQRYSFNLYAKLMCYLLHKSHLKGLISIGHEVEFKKEIISKPSHIGNQWHAIKL